MTQDELDLAIEASEKRLRALFNEAAATQPVPPINKTTQKDNLTHIMFGVMLTLTGISVYTQANGINFDPLNPMQSQKIQINQSAVTIPAAFDQYQEIKTDCGSVDLYDPTPSVESWEPCMPEQASLNETIKSEEEFLKAFYKASRMPVNI